MARGVFKLQIWKMIRSSAFCVLSLLLSSFSFDSSSVRYELMLSCWHRDPSQRPGFGELGQSLKALLSELPPLEASNEAHYINLGLEAASDHQDSAGTLEPEVERMM